jgi:hypothetical protein
MKNICLFDSTNLEECPWPKNEEGEKARKFLIPFMQNGVSNYIDNVKTTFRILVAGDWVFPITINEEEYDNSYVCSPYSYYISYAKESLQSLAQPAIYHAIKGILWGTSKFFRRYKINKVVSVNNWLTSTSLYPALEADQLGEITKFLQAEFPDHAIVFRCIDAHMANSCYEQLRQIGFEYIASRQVFFIDPHESSLFESRLFKSDLKLLKNSGYEVIEGKDLLKEDLSSLIELYRDVYIHKYSSLNPMWNENFLRLALSEGILEFKGLKKEGRVDGLVGYHTHHGKMFCPFFGYDKKIPQEIGLYRLLSTLLMLEASRQKVRFHLSSGASMFKKIRKARECLEYTAVYHQHLGFSRRIPWMILKKLCNSIGTVYMKSY